MESLRLQIKGIWYQVDEIRGWYTRFYLVMDIAVPLGVDWEKGKKEQFLLIDGALIPPVTHSLRGEFWG